MTHTVEVLCTICQAPATCLVTPWEGDNLAEGCTFEWKRTCACVNNPDVDYRDYDDMMEAAALGAAGRAG